MKNIEKIVFFVLFFDNKKKYFYLSVRQNIDYLSIVKYNNRMENKKTDKIVRFIDYYDTVDISITTCGRQFVKKAIDGPYEPDAHVLQYVTSGKGYLELNGKKYSLVKGDLFYLPEGKTCCYYGDATDPYTYYWIAFQGKYAEHLLKHCNITIDNPVLHVNNKRAEKQFELMFNNMRKNKLPDVLMVLAHLYTLFSLLLKSTYPDKAVGGHYLIEESIVYMDHHFSEQITVNDVCKHLNCDVSHFIKIFKKNQGVSPKKYLDSLRLIRVKSLLKENKLTIAQAAENVGIADYSRFYKWFKKETGRTPRQYRAEKLQNR